MSLKSAGCSGQCLIVRRLADLFAANPKPEQGHSHAKVMTINSGILFLEKFIEDSNLLPSDLGRLLNFIKALDERLQGAPYIGHHTRRFSDDRVRSMIMIDWPYIMAPLHDYYASQVHTLITADKDSKRLAMLAD